MKQNSLYKFLELASLEDLKCFAQSYAKNDKPFEKALTDFLSEKYIDEEDGASDAICRLEDAFMETKDIGNRWHSYEVTAWDEVVSVGENVLTDAQRLMEMGNAKAALLIATRMFELGDGEDLNYVDEMDEWAIGSMFERYGKLMVEALSDKSVSQTDKDDAIALLRKMTKSQLDDYGYVDIHQLLREALAVAQSDEAMLKMLDEMLHETTREGELVEYVRRKIILLQKMNRKADTEPTIKQYLHLPAIRKDEIQKKLDAGNLYAALALAEEGQNTSGWETDWLELEFGIYGRMNNQQQQLAVCRELFIKEGGSMRNYERLKALVPSQEWLEFLKTLLSQTKMDAWFSSSVKADIYVAEHDVEQLFHLLMSDDDHHTLDMFDKYAPKLHKEHASEILTEYAVMLKDYASRNMGAKHYGRMRHAMEAMLKMPGGKEATHQLAEFFRETYRRRPSFMAEIEKF
jgi:hypothetical protein